VLKRRGGAIAEGVAGTWCLTLCGLKPYNCFFIYLAPFPLDESASQAYKISDASQCALRRYHVNVLPQARKKESKKEREPQEKNESNTHNTNNIIV